MDKLNFIWEWIELFGENGKRDLIWAEELDEGLNDLRPFLLRVEELASRVPCERYKAGGGCQYRIMKMTRGNLVGVCDEKECPTLDFTETELLQSKVNLPKLLREISQLMQLQPVVEPIDRQRYQWTLATVPGSGSEAVTVYFVRGVLDHTFEAAVLNLLADTSAPFILITATPMRHTPRLIKQIKGGGCAVFTLATNFQVTDKRISWLPGARERWEELLATVNGGTLGVSAAVQEAVAQPYVRAIERGFAAIGKDFGKYRAEIETLRNDLANQLGRIAREVDPEFFQIIMSIMVCGSVRSAAEKLGTSKSSLDRRLKDFVARGGLYATLNGLLSVRTDHLGRRRLESLNPDFADHIADRSEPQREAIIAELIEALQAADPENWAEILMEFSESLQDMR